MSKFAHYYRKGWTSEKLWTQFVEAVHTGDTFHIGSAVKAQAAERAPWDCGIFALRCHDEDLASRPLTSPAVNSKETIEEAKLCLWLASNRDMRLVNLPTTLHPGYREISYFLKDKIIHSFVNRDYMYSKETYEHVQAGKNPLEQQTYDKSGIITTGRHCARYVHDDSPVVQWNDVVVSLMRNEVAINYPNDISECNQVGFACWGYPFIMGIVGEIILRAGCVSFRHKWQEMYPRPEQFCVDAGLGYLPQCYAEGSPMHPSRNAMHSIVALAVAAGLKKIFDTNHVLPSANTVGEELDLFADNIGYWRVWAGVHYPSDHDAVREQAKIIGERVVREHQ